MGLHSAGMSADLVKTMTLNGKRLQTGRDVLTRADVVGLAGFGPGARVTVTVRQKLAVATSARTVEPGEYVSTQDGLVLEVKARV